MKSIKTLLVATTLVALLVNSASAERRLGRRHLVARTATAVASAPCALAQRVEERRVCPDQAKPDQCACAKPDQAKPDQCKVCIATPAPVVLPAPVTVAPTACGPASCAGQREHRQWRFRHRSCCG
jgi:hypothetical protein